MGYELHITRRESWFEDDGNDITLEEWVNYVNSDNELVLTNGYLTKVPGIIDTFQNVPGFCEWLNHSKKAREDKPWFDYQDGVVSAKYPDEETVHKMVRIANKLNANVQGDDGEIYDETYTDSPISTKNEHSINASIHKPWWKFW